MSTSTTTSGPEAGVSIVEVLIALLVFTIGALAASQNTLSARQQAKAAERRPKQIRVPSEGCSATYAPPVHGSASS